MARVAPTCSAGGFVANRLAGARLHTMPGGRTIVPLLHPQQHNLPFLLAVELHASPEASSRSSASLQHTAPPPLDKGLYELHYVLAGSGQLQRAAGSEEALQAGDSVLMHSGAAACRAADGEPPAAAAASPAGLPPGSPWQLAELVAYMPRQLFDQQAGQEEEAQQGLQRLPWQRGPRRQQQQGVEREALRQLLRSQSLQPLLGQQPGGAARDGGSSSSSGGCGEGELLPEEFVGALLAGARDTARQALMAQEGRDFLSDSGSDTEQSRGGSSSSSKGSSKGSSSSNDVSGSRRCGSSSLLPPALHALAERVAGWWAEQQGRACPVTKRRLSELTAFRLPNQTNRLAVQFDPFSRPNVPFISGIEVFERGHRTTPHVHPHAHELFFILAGEGTGFCGDQRFPVRAGDVVVFRPGAVHGIDNGDASRMYCLELMFPNEAFAEFVRQGEDTGHLSGDDLCVLAAIGCR